MNDYAPIPVSQPALIGNEKKYVLECLDSTWISSNGKYISLFEQQFCEYHNVKHAIPCANGTVALHLALLALGIGPGDEVIVPALTFVATANAVVYTGAQPVFADSEADTWNLDPDRIRELVTPKTKAIIAVHLYGHPCEMDRIAAVAQDNRLYLVEDSAEALGASYHGKKCGSLADIATFSFYGNKTITTGEGGMVLTNSRNLANKARLLMRQGVDPQRRYWFTELGYNYRMTNIQAAIGLGQMENIDKFLVKRRQIAGWYKENLKDIPGLTLPIERENCIHCYWMYSVLIEKQCGRTRDELMKELAIKGIETRPFFYPMHTLPVYKDVQFSDLTTAEQISSKGINLPTFFDLEKKQIAYIARIIRRQIQK